MTTLLHPDVSELLVTVVIPRPPSATRPPKPPRAPRVPKPPRRAPRAPRAPQPLTQSQVIARGLFGILAAMLLTFALNVTAFSQIQHLVAQQQLSNEFIQELANGTAPVSEGDYNGALLADGAPIGVIDIPAVGVHEIISEGTSADTMKSGPGHRRDTVLPGQVGVSVVFGRAAAYGGPFGRIQELAPGDRFTVRTGQGQETFSVIGVRYAGDPAPSAPTGSQSRLILESARGAAFIPSGIAYVDAQAVGSALPAGVRQTSYLALPQPDHAMATDNSTVWALVFALQFLLAVEIAAVWCYRRVGAQKTWVVFVPLTLLAALCVTNQVTILLPNLL